ncbi:hypothetical protein KDA_76670 [Dictyobacter alpinus]|uniref:Uncharacterized protein n=1 Tax=Dictyobacter alpinus TaxID=2014873 RepID=A0A402BLE6_9CHLR|nr:hypothetical protein KDA_76670 [Dictyobacter alpinus]
MLLLGLLIIRGSILQVGVVALMHSGFYRGLSGATATADRLTAAKLRGPLQSDFWGNIQFLS